MARKFISIDPKKVIIPEFRQRNNAEPDEALLTSLQRRGQLQPIVLHKDNVLVAGERRLRAALKLDWPKIDAAIFEELDEIGKHEAELQENLARKQLRWQEEVAAIGAYHEMRKKAFGGWTQKGTAEALGLSEGYVSQLLAVYTELGDDAITGCPTMKGAYNLVYSRAQRARIAAAARGLIAEPSAMLLPNISPNASKEERTAALMQSFDTAKIAGETLDDIDRNMEALRKGEEAKLLLAEQKKLKIVSDLVVVADFLEWAESYKGDKFDVLHVDFPYGKGYSGARTRRTGKNHICPVYADDPDIFFSLVEGFLALQDRFTLPVAHCLFWYDAMYQQWIIDQFTAAGWKQVAPHPYIWTKGYSGIASDTNRRPRHCYETALMFSRGDRKLVKLDKDHFECAIDEKLHMNQKPMAMLKHFLSMFVDEHSEVLDPTCGSGSALSAAQALGAARVLGVELDPDNADVAKLLLRRTLPQEATDE